ncbi:hypothetical protein [Comamonas sp. JC664]|uniref:hypothetical protein n=1 Tax=Comamonas sp. JC664 TaxID=2801917 RepID=UPI0017484F29|nr:hypothetical protein [Comamonas sp. JC664]MBL0697397.1 hypothetical protein [Comamonas sp. JC664]GHG67494.1 hypothetical protein GCM10012319_09850 [Comamonas sp. KCTC 72670]
MSGQRSHGTAGLQGPGVLRRRYVRRAPGASREATPEGAVVASRGASAGGGLLASGQLVPLFVGLLMVCQVALLVEALAPLRVVVRVLAFGVSLLLLVLVRGKGLVHPALPFVLGALGFTALQFVNPGTGAPLAAVAQVGIQLAIAAPLLWVSRLSLDLRTFRRTLALLFLFNAASAGVGVLQVYFPGRFQPALSSVVSGQGEGYVNSLQFETTDGARVFRPMGLTDIPGGASTGGFYAVLLGGGFLLSSRRGPYRLLSLGGILVGLFSLYLSQVRAMAVMLAVCLVALAAVLALSGRLGRLLALLAVVGTAGVATFGWAAAVGGGAVVDRWSALFESNPEDVYQRNRGYFLTGTFDTLLPEYPLGAGLGRYGMVNAYFGDPTDFERPSLWAEIQWTAWVYDGGILVLLLYPTSLLVSLWWAFRVARSREDPDREFWLWGALLFAYNLGALALTFSYPFFMSQTGMEFWLLNAALFSAMSHAKTVHAHRR